DLLSALLHCHENGVVLRGSLNLDQIVIDHSGVAKIGSLYKSSSDRRKKESRKYDDDEQDEIMKDPYVPPEMLLGSPKYTMETDIWALGCLLSHLLLSKPIYTGKEKDRESLLFAMYKLVGIPAPENFELGAKFPYYKKPEKKYKPGVEKAIPKLMKDRKCDDVEAYTSAIDLIRQMLHLDPEKRITAKMALQH
ncbi:kinase-like protein, partial [Fragilariopsis cylindrus CCMP1102]